MASSSSEGTQMQLIIGSRLKTAVVIVGQSQMIGKKENVIYGVIGSPEHTNLIIGKLRNEIKNRETVEYYVEKISSYIKNDMKLNREDAVTVMIGGFDFSSPRKALLYRINKMGSIWIEKVMCAGNGSSYADMIVEDGKTYNRRMSSQEVFNVGKKVCNFAANEESSSATTYCTSQIGHVELELPEREESDEEELKQEQ